MPLRRWFNSTFRDEWRPLIAWVAVAAYLFQDGIEVVFYFRARRLGRGGPPSSWSSPSYCSPLSAGLAWAAYFLVRAVLRRLPMGIGTGGRAPPDRREPRLHDQLRLQASSRMRPSVRSCGRSLVLALCILVTGMGGGAMISWGLAPRGAQRLGDRNYGLDRSPGHPDAGRVLLLLAEVWQMASALS